MPIKSRDDTTEIRKSSCLFNTLTKLPARGKSRNCKTSLSLMQSGIVLRLSDTAQFSTLRRAHRTPCRSTAQQNFGARSRNNIADRPPLLLLPAPGAPSFCTGARDHGRLACPDARPVRRLISKVGIHSAIAEHSDQLEALVRSKTVPKHQHEGGIIDSSFVTGHVEKI